MNHLLGQVSYPVFISGVFVFFIIASVFSFIVGVGLALRSQRMIRFFNFMNRSYSTRRMTRPLTEPHFVEPTLLKHPKTLGVGIVAGAIVSIALLFDVDDIVFQPMYNGSFTNETAEILANYTHSFLLVGNAICIIVGVMLLFFPHVLSNIESYTDKWYTLRKQTRPLHENYIEVDKWVLAHPTVSGVTLSLLSLGLGISMYMRL
ncbi:hypothetical protein [Sideroxydans lithotrophicus]|uniref:Uncharacterized protein n=1 Tax=Sideroxydans lithotrophicus (strain ES-1) TaxID=580332 RepID=D5CR51_SIDLE|nr:hypothetical protein [Sideroxydans lithotrophicus]ADE11437.1 hypothetical protein Slit_1199 [Sideroxydans lithotrophicus ES-1]